MNDLKPCPRCDSVNLRHYAAASMKTPMVKCDDCQYFNASEMWNEGKGKNGWDHLWIIKVRTLQAQLDKAKAFHPRAMKLITKGKQFVVVALDEPYYKIVYGMIREHELSKGTWSGEDEENFVNALPVLGANMHNKLQIIYENNKPCGIRDENGYLFFFTKISKYSGQEERYRQEVQEQYELADYLLSVLQARALGGNDDR